MNHTRSQTTEVRRILVADHTSTLGKSIIENFHQNGSSDFKYQTTASAVEFEALLQQHGWDVVICKYAHIPFETTDLLRAAQRLQPQTPVIVVGEQVTTREALELGRLGVREFVETSDTPRLIACIQQALSSGQTDSFTNGSAAGAESSAAQQLRLVLDSMQDAIMSLSLPDRRLIFVSSSYERVFGYPAEAFQKNQELYKQVMPPDEVEMGTTALQTLYRDGFVELDHRVIFPNGEAHWLHRRAWINYDSQGNPVQVVDTARDITARKLLEEELKSITRKQGAILDSLPDMMFHLRADGAILDYHFHASIADLVLPPELFVGKHMSDFVNSSVIPPDALQQAVDAMQTATTFRQPVTFEYTMPDQHYYEARVLPIEDSDELIILARDITERKQTEAKLRESADWKQLTLEASELGTWRHDLRTQYLYLDERARRHYGIDADCVPVQSMFERIHPEDIAQVSEKVIAAILPDASGHLTVEYRTLHPDGTTHWLVVRALIYFEEVDGARQAVMTFGTTQDITERKLAEDALQRSEAYLCSLVNSETAFNLRVDMQGRISYCNERYRRQFAWATPSIIGMPPLEVVHPDDQYKVYDAVAACLADSTKTVQLEIRKGTESGDYIWTLWEFSAVPDSAGAVQEIHCVGFDISKQKQAEAALQEANRLLEQRVRERTLELQEERNLLRTVIDAIPDSIYVKDRQHRMVLNNFAHIRSVGLANSAEMIGKTDLDLFPPEMANQFHADEDRLFATEQAIINLEERNIRADGSDVWMLTSKVPLRNVQGELIGLVGITRDITTIKVANEALRVSEERYQATVAAMSEGVVVQNRDGTIQLCNSAAERILGLTKDQMMGRTSVDPRWRAIHEDGSPFPGETHPAMVALHTGEPQVNVVMGVHKPDDTLTWILINAQSLIDPVDQQRYAVVATFADITNPKLAEAAIKAALAHEKELGELKSRLVSMASHEFRTPLASILAATEMLTMYWERLDKPKITDRLNRIHEQVDRMTVIMEDVLQLTRLQTGRTNFEPTPGDLDALCLSVVNELADLPDYHDRIHYECSQHPLNAVFDARLLRQAITNLLHNGLKYSPPETTVRITLAQEHGQITLRITDEGIGIPPEDVKHLFEPFHRAANVGEISGTGLGLAIAKEAVELHGGTITVESQVNAGTTFTVTLPEHP